METLATRGRKGHASRTIKLKPNAVAMLKNLSCENRLNRTSFSFGWSNDESMDHFSTSFAASSTVFAVAL